MPIQIEIAASHRRIVAGDARVSIEIAGIVAPPSIAMSDYGTIRTTVSGGPGNVRDWVGVFRVGSSNQAFTSWKYLNNTQVRPTVGLTGGRVDLVVPPTPGNYEFRFLTATGTNEYERLVTSGTLVVG